MNTSGKILTAVAGGLAAGIVLGILVAPDKGSETRRKISEGGKKIAEGIKETVQKGREKMHAMKEELEQSVKEKLEEYA
ncbi:MAG TPA: YtxH domain-containing protein [Ferruginibacter sp.]|nr:YtxH domain-containing protein [Ferruginibacter sp.]HMP19342.1 YtxH domain-containing protein [Ferruginibacter sp.]